MATTEALKAQN